MLTDLLFRVRALVRRRRGRRGTGRGASRPSRARDAEVHGGGPLAVRGRAARTSGDGRPRRGQGTVPRCARHQAARRLRHGPAVRSAPADAIAGIRRGRHRDARASASARRRRSSASSRASCSGRCPIRTRSASSRWRTSTSRAGVTASRCRTSAIGPPRRRASRPSPPCAGTPRRRWSAARAIESTRSAFTATSCECLGPPRPRPPDHARRDPVRRAGRSRVAWLCAERRRRCASSGWRSHRDLAARR